MAVSWASSFKAFALTGRQGCVLNYPGRCPELGASALSGRAAKNKLFNLLNSKDYEERHMEDGVADSHQHLDGNRNHARDHELRRLARTSCAG